MFMKFSLTKYLSFLLIFISTLHSLDIQVNEYITGVQRYASMCQLNDGSIIVAWADEGQGQIMFKQYAQNLDIIKADTAIGALSAS